MERTQETQNNGNAAQPRLFSWTLCVSGRYYSLGGPSLWKESRQVVDKAQELEISRSALFPDRVVWPSRSHLSTPLPHYFLGQEKKYYINFGLRKQWSSNSIFLALTRSALRRTTSRQIHRFVLLFSVFYSCFFFRVRGNEASPRRSNFAQIPCRPICDRQRNFRLRVYRLRD